MPRAERRDQLLDSALKLISEQGYGGVTMEGVAREAEIAKTVVYDAFGDKGELLQALFEREQRRVLTALAEAVPTPPLSGDPADILAGAIAKGLESVRRYPGDVAADPGARRRDAAVASRRGQPASRAAREAGRADDRLGNGELGIERLDPELTAHALIAAAEDAARLTLTHPAAVSAGADRGLRGRGGRGGRRDSGDPPVTRPAPEVELRSRPA